MTHPIFINHIASLRFHAAESVQRQWSLSGPLVQANAIIKQANQCKNWQTQCHVSNISLLLQCSSLFKKKFDSTLWHLLCQVGEPLNTDQGHAPPKLKKQMPWGCFWGHFWSIITAKIWQGYYSIDTYATLTGSPHPVMTHGTTTVETTQNDTWKSWNLMTGGAFITLPNSYGMYLHFENTDTHEKGFHHSPASALLYTPMVMVWITFIASSISQL